MGIEVGDFRVNQIFLMDSFSPSDERLIVWGPGVKRTTTWYNKYWIWNIQFSYEVWHVCQRDHWIECKTNVPNFLSFCLPFHISLRLFLGLRPNPASGDYLLLEGWGRFKLRLKNQSRDYFYIKLGIFEVWNYHKLKSCKIKIWEKSSKMWILMKFQGSNREPLECETNALPLHYF